MSESHTYDLAVVGGGIAGLAAASRAAEQGLKVALFERGAGEQYLCNTRYSGGVLHVAFRNIKNRPEELLQAITDATRGNAEPALARALARTCGRAVDWLGKEGAKFVRMSQVEWQHWVLAPPRRIMPGLDWEGRGPDFMLRTLAKNLASRGGRIFRATEATALMHRNGSCIGVEARNSEGNHQFNAGAVVLADGGFQANLELVRRHICAAPEKLKQRGASTGVGDGLRMAQALGAEITDPDYFYGHVLSRDAFTNPKVWPYPQLDELGMAGIMVDAAGKRFADEGLGGVYLANAIAKRPDPLSTWAIFDEAIWEGPGRDARIPANPHFANGGGTIVKANTLKELGAQTGIPADALEATVSGYQQALASGDLARLDPPRTVADHKPWPISRPSFYAVPVCAGITYTLGGIAIDEHGRARRPTGEPISGLYAAGSTTAGIEGRSSCTYVGGLMKGLVFGMRAAEHIAQALRLKR